MSEAGHSAAPEHIQGRSGRLWVPNRDLSKWSSHVYRVYATADSLVLGNALGFTVSTLGPKSQRSHRSFGIDLTDAQVEEAAFSGLFEDLGKLEGQPGFVVTDGQEERHFFGAASREEQKLWVACLRGLTRLDDSQPSHGVVQLTARSIITLNGHGTEHVRECSERTLAQEREYSRTLELKVQDLEAEKQGVQEALKAALQMMSERNPRSSERSSERSPQKNEDTRASAAQANDAEISTRIESAALVLQQSEKTMSDLVYELSSMVQQRDAAQLALATIRGEDVYSDAGSEFRSTTPNTIQKRPGSILKSSVFPDPITLPEGDEAIEPKPLHVAPVGGGRRSNGTTPRGVTPRRKSNTGSTGSRGSGDAGRITFV
eukprot:Tamp_20907.p1 GENE.Tamp_20907~~Tamp_20907.p1  ORF type:complete len:390 (+),score=54.34 Tamp_20907:47-1171(+)